MTDAEWIFHQDVKQKKSVKNSAYKMNRTGKGPVRFPSDFLTKKELEKMNGEVVSVNLNKRYSYTDFKRLPDKFKVEYINKLIKRFNVPIQTISTKVFERSRATLRTYLVDKGLHGQIIHKTGKMSMDQMWDFNLWLNGTETYENKTDTPEEVSIPHIPDIKPAMIPERSGWVKSMEFEMEGYDRDILEQIINMFGTDIHIKIIITEG